MGSLGVVRKVLSLISQLETLEPEQREPSHNGVTNINPPFWNVERIGGGKLELSQKARFYQPAESKPLIPVLCPAQCPGKASPVLGEDSLWAMTASPGSPSPWWLTENTKVFEPLRWGVWPVSWARSLWRAKVHPRVGLPCVIQCIKIHPAMKETQVQSLVGELRSCTPQLRPNATK